ncbi:NAD(P)H-dependent oxidoreductase [Exiguobacterium acetylicum]|uniref:NAD(P)H-dependent oxidoreductase n=1 Tax=Exiguobacterium acetylicum TaxID=41170 RepID=UPI001CA69D43|nr:NAD(P)H-dependent oxidoreductase [Exiguobacterium acetylicum]QZY88222.1 NAD(P)H-dependent oxidoreductase [Exiguobacterium acetylicum]
MKTLVIVAHPDLTNSRINRTWMHAFQQQENVMVHDLYAAYPDFKIDVKREQELLMAHDRIVLQFPFFWYSSPALLKLWQDEVLAYGWAYGQAGTRLHGKELLLAFSTGGPAEAYQPSGLNRFTFDQLTTPFQAMANLTGMTFLPPYILSGVRTLSDEALAEATTSLIDRTLLVPTRK